MIKRSCIILIFIFLLTSLSSIHFDLKEVKGAAPVVIFIRNDGSIETVPVTATPNITSLDNITYSFTDKNDAFLIIERGNIVVAGSGYSLEGAGSDKGLTWSSISNVTIQNMAIKGFSWAVEIYNSSHNLFHQVNITNNKNYGFYITNCTNSTISHSQVLDNGGTTFAGHAAIAVSSSSNFTLRLNRIINNPWLEGIRLRYSSNCHVHDNNLAGNYFGIRFSSADNNYLYGNNITTSAHTGVSVHESLNNSLHNNTLDNNRYGIRVEGYEFNHYLNNLHTSNSVNGKPVYYLKNQHNLNINPSTHPEIGYLALINSTSIHIESHNFTGNGQGLLLSYTNNSEISANRITNNYDGLMLFNSYNNTIQTNEIIDNTNQGAYLWDSDRNRVFHNEMMRHQGPSLYLSDSSDNTIYSNTFAHSEYGIEVFGTGNMLYHNNFINNTEHIDSSGLLNFWNNSIEGNYWDDYLDTDSDEDGIGDSPYVIDANNTDHYPLMNVFWNPCDINHDLTVDMKDIGIAAKAYGSEPGDPLWNPHADITGYDHLVPDGKVEMRDIGLIARNYGESHS